MHHTTHTTKRSQRNPWLALAALTTTFTIASQLTAGTPVFSTDSTAIDTSVTTEVKSSIFDTIWGFATLYKDDANPIIQEVKLRGRYHTQYYWVENEENDLTEDDREDRRSRIGFDIKMFNKKIEIRADVQSTDGFEPKYGGLVDVFVKWKQSEAFNLTVGRQKPQIAYYDWLQSTNNQPTFERSQIFNQLGVERLVGAVVDGKINNFTYQAGIYQNNVNREFGEWQGSYSYSAGIGYDLKKVLNTEKADLRFDWLHTDHDGDDSFLRTYDDIVTGTFWLKEGYASVVLEAFYATGKTAADAIGFYIQPTYDIIPQKLQAVGRFTYSTGSGTNPINRQTRYESLVGAGRGEEYYAIYGGLQYFIYGDKLKLMAGVEYANLDGGGDGGDYDGVTYLTGLRLSF